MHATNRYRQRHVVEAVFFHVHWYQLKVWYLHCPSACARHVDRTRGLKL